MNRRRALGAALAASAGLAGCATPTAPPGTTTLSGRLSVRVAATADRPERGATSLFELRGDARQGELDLSTPLGNRVAQARWTPSGAELTTSDGHSRYPGLDAMAEQLLGEALPLAALVDWLHGRPWTGAPSRQTAAGFEQMGWTVDLARRSDGWMAAERPATPAIQVRAKIDEATP